MVSVAIIGAGPAGLVAAKTLLHSSSEGPAPTVTVFEQGTNVGGLWAVESNCNGIINPGMNTNLSKFTVCFSDLAWDSLELQPPANIYPQAWQVNRYLNTYAAKYIPAGVIFLQTYVKVVEYLQTPFDQEKRWKITTITRAGDNWTEREDIFDYLIIASGFFSKARQKPFSCHSTTTENDDCLPTILHSSQYRQLSDLSLTNQPPTMGKILVIGGSHSGGEVASLIAMQMSDARHSPVGSGAQPLDIIHAMPHPLVSIPSFVRTGNENCPTFMQLDSRLYDLSSRPDDPISFNFGFTNAEKRKKLKDTLAMLMSGTAHAQDDNLVVQADRDKFGAPYAVVGDKYVEFVRSGAIKQVLGRITQVEQPLEEGNLMHATIVSQSEHVKIGEIAAVVYATGFSSSPALDFLPEQIKDSLGYDASYPRLPLLLTQDCLTSSQDSPSNLALMGFFDGSYWGVLESQARTIARKWAQTSKTQLFTPAQNETKSTKSSKLRAFMEELRVVMKKDPLSVPQNFFGDYPGLMEEICRELGLKKINLAWGEREGMVTPARYVDDGCDISEAEKTMLKLQQTIKDSFKGSAAFARATFRGLQGDWRINTNARSDKSFEMSSFHPRYPTDPNSDFEYIYIPHYKAQNYLVSRLVYRLRESKNQIEVWNVGQKCELTADKIHHVLDFNDGLVVDKSGLNVISIAAREGLDADLGVKIMYSFWFAGVAITKFEIESFNEDNVKIDSFEFVR